MKIKYWVYPSATKQIPLSPSREPDGRVLVEVPLGDFIYEAVYGNSEDYGQKERSQQWFTLMAYDLLAQAGLLTVEKLRSILSTAYTIAHEDSHGRGYTTIESIVP